MANNTRIMKVKRLISIINVSNIEESFAWFEKLGWKKGWDGVIRLTSEAFAMEIARSSSAKTARDLAVARCLGTLEMMTREGSG
ncbi:hypothetical protein BH18ACI4_BH18ACI4_21070 [soil metagenome]